MHRIKIQDYNAQNDYKVNSPAGEYAILYATASYDDGDTTPSSGDIISTSVADTGQYNDRVPVGLLYYQAGVAVVSSSVFLDNDGGSRAVDGGKGILYAAGAQLTPRLNTGLSSKDVDTWSNHATALLTGSSIQANALGFRHMMYNLQFNNTTELNSTIYFCRANHNEFNYSSNPTYLSASKVFVKENNLDVPVAYATTVGLYSADNELMAVAKLSEPLKKTPNNELTFRVRLDY